MKLYKDSKDFQNLQVYDLETLKCCFLGGFYNPDTKSYNEFEISKYKNDLYKLVKFYTSENIDYCIGFNNVGFDAQVLHFISENHQKWIDNSNLEIASIIYNFVQNLIESQKYNLPLPYYESNFKVNQIDVFKIFHFDNKSKSCSLKQCQFAMNWYNVETMPIHHNVASLTENEILSISSYMQNDIFSTLEVFKWCLGDSPNPNYKGKNKIEDRFAMIEEEGLNCLNWSDVKIGEESNLKDYLEISKRKKDTVFPIKPKHFYGMKYKNFFPNTVEFQSDKVKEFIKKIGNTTILKDKQEFKIELGGNNICIGRGGLHSSETGRIIKSNDQYQITQCDIGLTKWPN